MEADRQLHRRTRVALRDVRDQLERERQTCRRLELALIRSRARIGEIHRPPQTHLLLGFAAHGPLLVMVSTLQLEAPVPSEPELALVPGTPQEVRPIEQRSDCPAGQSCNPIHIDSWPFGVSGDTTTGDQKIDRYSCAPHIPEPGPETWFEFHLDEPSRWIAEITEDPSDGVDIDLHVLTARYGWGCVIRDDRRIDTILPPGDYFLVLDSCAPQGTPLPGSYVLNVQSSAEAQSHPSREHKE